MASFDRSYRTFYWSGLGKCSLYVGKLFYIVYALYAQVMSCPPNFFTY